MRVLPQPITPATAMPVTVDQVRFDARIDTIEFDATIAEYIPAAVEMCEQETGLRLMQQVRRAEMYDWPRACDVIHINPATSAAVTWWDGAAWLTLSTSDYAMEPAPGGVVILPAPDATWPMLGIRAGARVRIDVTCGHSSADGVPASLKKWIRSHVVSWIDDTSATTEKARIPHPHMDALLYPHRIFPR
jgi:uncharacterized phiE125 gp8 family phage protein